MLVPNKFYNISALLNTEYNVNYFWNKYDECLTNQLKKNSQMWLIFRDQLYIKLGYQTIRDNLKKKGATIVTRYLNLTLAII